mmetsp:Transcript_10520/g.25632  ORF Transcript_10520/g.25632 Transcript_10520/m.25632 type:complete len:353 (-) Transcript_10520:664-1722(-)
MPLPLQQYLASLVFLPQSVETSLQLSAFTHYIRILSFSLRHFEQQLDLVLAFFFCLLLQYSFLLLQAFQALPQALQLTPQARILVLAPPTRIEPPSQFARQGPLLLRVALHRLGPLPHVKCKLLKLPISLSTILPSLVCLSQAPLQGLIANHQLCALPLQLLECLPLLVVLLPRSDIAITQLSNLPPQRVPLALEIPTDPFIPLTQTARLFQQIISIAYLLQHFLPLLRHRGTLGAKPGDLALANLSLLVCFLLPPFKLLLHQLFCPSDLGKLITQALHLSLSLPAQLHCLLFEGIHRLLHALRPLVLFPELPQQSFHPRLSSQRLFPLGSACPLKRLNLLPLDILMLFAFG